MRHPGRRQVDVKERELGYPTARTVRHSADSDARRGRRTAIGELHTCNRPTPLSISSCCFDEGVRHGNDDADLDRTHPNAASGRS